MTSGSVRRQVRCYVLRQVGIGLTAPGVDVEGKAECKDVVYGVRDFGCVGRYGDAGHQWRKRAVRFWVAEVALLPNSLMQKNSRTITQVAI